MARSTASMQRKMRKILQNRANIAFLVTVLLGFGIGITGIVKAGVINGAENKQKAEDAMVSDQTITAKRGSIYDSNMNVLAQSADAYKIYLDPSNIKDDAAAEELASGLSKLLDTDYETLLKKCKQSKRKYVVVATKVDYDTKKKVESFRKEKGFKQVIGFEEDVIRYYPYDNFASTVIGFTGDAGNGLSGIEYYYDSILSGTAGRSISAKNARHGMVAADYETYYKAQDGNSLKLTLNQTIQYYLDTALATAVESLDASYGYGIVMNSKTGAIYAMSSQPDYDLNNPYTITNEDVKKELDSIKNDDERSKATSDALYAQWRNRTITDTYEPGSVFKCVTAAAGIEEGIVSTDEDFVCTGSYQVEDRTYHCSNRSGHGKEDFSTSLANSCNPIFIQVAQRLGAKTFYKYFEAFGMTETTGVDLSAEATPREGVTYYALKNMRSVQLASSSFGQTFQVTPIQMITAINAIANDGELVQPYIVDSYLDADGNTIMKTEPTVKRQVVSKLTADTVTEMMEGVVEKGTASNAYVPGYHVAGKTGTSEKLASDSSYYIGSFCGFAPADDPEITVLIIIDEPKGGHFTGGTTAAPVAAEVIEKSLQYLNVAPSYTEAEKAKQDIAVANVTGLSTDSAKKKLEEQGLSVTVVGKGAKVLNQTPAGGKLVAQGGIVVLYTDSKDKTEQVEVPNLVGLSESAAKAAAKAAGLNVQISGKATGSSYKQSVKKGTKVARGSVITVSYMETGNKEVANEAKESGSVPED